ncbi:NAD(P)/FAD-dependent oxidoreductase [Microbacterium xanthum]|uniref:NAD(P)/FAD-dependent oxidoreductase n=1 Tax=Microbacterium xanthum TaxID=3079794 RepID=UPI002AD2EDB6|nr:NAD(P)/FAD-dependent oxidoreductase [Microbacterium sp. KSW-48]MDZ8172572.1 NAD(P)/FAD-dependent oxidoreductase [Microbacterium sp. KSW-48]
MDSAEVVVIGAGLAGLRCALELARAGREVVVLEAHDRVGGRQRTDRVDGFLLDRGFQVLNPAYPAVRRDIDVDSLGLRSFPVAVRVRLAGRTVELAHPLRHPARLPRTLASGLLDPQELSALARWALPTIVAPRRAVRGRDIPLADAWDTAGIHGPLRARVLEPFLAGVLADGSGATSDAFVRLLMRMFALGRPALPATGIEALPRQLARRVGGAGGRIRLSHRVARIDRDGPRILVVGPDIDTLRAGKVVVATGPDVVSDLVDLPRPVTRGLQTWWFDADAPPSASGAVHVDGTRSGPVVNTAVISHTVPEYAPAGQHLVQATCLLSPSDAADETAVRRHLVTIWGPAATGWRLLRRDDIPDALPAQPAPLRLRSTALVTDGVHVAGDHRDTASIQGALVSGTRVAQAVVAS